jgi:hypothetical protein
MHSEAISFDDKLKPADRFATIGDEHMELMAQTSP